MWIPRGSNYITPETLSHVNRFHKFPPWRTVPGFDRSVAIAFTKELDTVSTLLAEITRADRVESIHTGAIAVVDTSGKLVAHAGDAEMFLYFRSSAKPFQAIPVIESGAADQFGFTPAELALCCASHNAEEIHQSQVLAMLAKLGLGESALQCGAPMPSDEDAFAKVQLGETAKSPLQCDCSGKHSGMLAACLALGLPIDTYLDPAHPLQVQIKALVARGMRCHTGFACDGHRWVQPAYVWLDSACVRPLLRRTLPANRPCRCPESLAIGNDRLSGERVRQG